MTVSTNANCYECRWFKTHDIAQIRDGQGGIIGHYGPCQKRSPIALVTKSGHERTTYPQTTGDDCCGDFEQHHDRQRYLHLMNQRKRTP